MVTRFDRLEPPVPVSKNWFGRFESLASVLVSIKTELGIKK